MNPDEATEQAHSPTPWAYDTEYGNYIRDADGDAITAMNYADPEGDGVHIVRCVNAHDALVNALQAVLNIDSLPIGTTQGYASRVLAYDDALGKARTALALAKGGTE